VGKPRKWLLLSVHFLQALNNHFCKLRFPGVRFNGIVKHEVPEQMSEIQNLSIRSFDRDQFLKRCLGNEKLADKLMEKMVATLPEELVQLTQEVNDERMDEAARRAHRLKGSAANLCAAPLSEVASRIEDAARRNVPDEVKELLNSINDCIEKLIGEYRESKSL
jgi:HPt (histidine-containing phosphotransfer) domain-containing protein